MLDKRNRCLSQFLHPDAGCTDIKPGGPFTSRRAQLFPQTVIRHQAAQGLFQRSGFIRCRQQCCISNQSRQRAHRGRYDRRTTAHSLQSGHAKRLLPAARHDDNFRLRHRFQHSLMRSIPRHHDTSSRSKRPKLFQVRRFGGIGPKPICPHDNGPPPWMTSADMVPGPNKRIHSLIRHNSPGKQNNLLSFARNRQHRQIETVGLHFGPDRSAAFPKTLDHPFRNTTDQNMPRQILTLPNRLCAAHGAGIVMQNQTDWPKPCQKTRQIRPIVNFRQNWSRRPHHSDTGQTKTPAIRNRNSWYG